MPADENQSVSSSVVHAGQQQQQADYSNDEGADQRDDSSESKSDMSSGDSTTTVDSNSDEEQGERSIGPQSGEQFLSALNFHNDHFILQSQQDWIALQRLLSMPNLASLIEVSASWDKTSGQGVRTMKVLGACFRLSF